MNFQQLRTTDWYQESVGQNDPDKLIPLGYEETSYINDMSPSFQKAVTKTQALRVWLIHEDWFAVDIMVGSEDCFDEYVANIYKTDDFKKLQKALPILEATLMSKDSVVEKATHAFFKTIADSYDIDTGEYPIEETLAFDEFAKSSFDTFIRWNAGESF